MKYKPIVNQPFQSTANVLAAAFSFVKAYDPQLRRLEDRWDLISGGVAIRDTFNMQLLPIGRDPVGDEFDPDDLHCFYADTDPYILVKDLSREQLDDLLDVFNELYSADCFAVDKTPIGYGFYKCV